MSDTEPPPVPSDDPPSSSTPPARPPKRNIDRVHDAASSAAHAARDTANQAVKGTADVVAKAAGVAQDVAKGTAGAVGKAVDVAQDAAKDAAKGTVDVVGKAVDVVGKVLDVPLPLSGLLPGLGRTKEGKRHRSRPGAAPGIEHSPDIDTPPEPGKVRYRHIAFGDNVVHDKSFSDLDAVLADEAPAGTTVRWINVDGLHPFVINKFRERFGFHTLAAEDTLHVPQRSKMEAFEDNLFVVSRMLEVRANVLASEQISFFLFKGLLITFQETSGDVWQVIRDRIHKPGSKVRKGDAAYLLYSLLDAIVDQCFPILEHYGERLDKLESRVLNRPDPMTLKRVHAIKRELSLLRRLMWPMREMVDHLYRDESGLLSDNARTYLRDVHDHAIQVIDIIETYREMAGGLTDLYMSAVGNRMNEVMKVLTIMASFFIPITFIAGVYGMNFNDGSPNGTIPELRWHHGYLFFWMLCLGVTLGLLAYFWKKGWLTSGDK